MTASSDKELEVKFYINDLVAFETRLLELGACLVHPRVHEQNLRFDTPTRYLMRTAKVLRLRRDSEVRLTYKGPSQVEGGVRSRQELEFSVDNFDTAHAFLNALGFLVNMEYEKYRTTYELDGVLVTLDEMPFGNFIELEGQDASSIQEVNKRLDLDWQARIIDSYVMLFQTASRNLELAVRDLTFENFEGVSVTPDDLGVRPVDG